MQKQVCVGSGSVEYENLLVRLEIAESETLPAVQLFIEICCDLKTVVLKF